jgi:hypothetical protein
MALLDISEVTRSIINIIDHSFTRFSLWGGGGGTVPGVFPEPPVRAKVRGIGFYLYHIVENGHYKNLPSPGGNSPPVRFNPMALNLYYQLSANSISGEGFDAFDEQKMMGIAMKALHDFPEITDETKVSDGTTDHLVLTGDLRGAGNNFKICLQPIQPNEAVQYWTAGESPIKLSAYYEVSVILLEPEEIQARTARVLSYGVHVFTQGAPRLISSRNTISFDIQGQPRSLLLQPAQAPPSDAAVSPNSRVEFVGTGLSGDSTQLLLLNARWDEPRIAGPAWGVVVQGDQLSFTVREMARLQASGSLDTEAMLPGIYAAQLRVTRQRMTSTGATALVEHLSNQCPFTVTPRIDSIITPIAPATTFTVKGYAFTIPDPANPLLKLGITELEVYVERVRLIRTTNAVAVAGEFRVNLVTGNLELTVPNDKPGEIELSGKTVPLRIFVFGAESIPHWIQVS